MTVESLKEFVASLSGKDKAQITASTRLSALLQGSLVRVRLEAGLRHRLGVAKAGVHQAVTFGDLCRSLGIEGDSPSLQETAQKAGVGQAPVINAKAEVATGGVHVGIDVEHMSALPETSDYWDHDFYKNIFSPREIAYALLQPFPRESFAGAWCAKEALRKARPALVQAEWTALEVVHDASGKPTMTIHGNAAGGAVSISHTSEFAIAVFVVTEAIQPPPVIEQRQNPTIPLPSTPKAGSSSLILPLITFLISLVALYFSIFRR